MQIKCGEEYNGPGKADPSKSRVEREKELRGFLRSPAGQEIVEYEFAKYTGMFQGLVPTPGVSVVESILNHGYPNG